MGMFNIIDIRRNCPKCGAKVEWQTKDLVIDNIYPVENILRKYTLGKHMTASVYTFCDGCKTWSEVKINDGKLGEMRIGKFEKVTR